MDRIDEAVRFTVVDSDYYGTGRAPSDAAFVVDHRWRLADSRRAPVLDEVLEAGNGR
jgi:hypothetical protein